MSVYVDKLRNWGWRLGPSCHLYADTNEELHAFAKKIGLKREWFQESTSGPHYDLTVSRREKAVRLGAIEHTDRQMVNYMRAWRKTAVARIKAAKTEEEKATIRKELYA
jgi:hypothetical protein